MTRSTAIIFNDLFEHLGDFERWDLGEVLADAAYGCNILNSETKRLVKELFESIDNTDDLSYDDIVEAIRHIGTPFAVTVANDMRDAEPIVD